MNAFGFAWWSRPTAAELFDLKDAGDLSEIQARYRGTRLPILNEILGHADDLGARSVVAEYRYLDADYRNEHSRFYSTTFRRYPSIAHRLHFFRDVLPAAVLDETEPTQFSDYHYLGYSVMRPVPAGPVGRTLLAPPLDMERHVSCKADDSVNLFGSKLTVSGAPFMTQESQLGVCVHITAWVCAYYHHLRFGSPRHLPGEIAALAPHEKGRLIPAMGMSVGQLSSMVERAGLPPLVYDLRDLRPGEDLFTIACRYLNSGFPVIVAGGGHAFVLVGYRRVAGGAGTRIEFIRQDDQAGPYLPIKDPLLDCWRPWEYLVIPLPPKVYVSGEVAEPVGASKLTAALDASSQTEYAALSQRISGGEVMFRTTAMQSNEFKAKLAARGAPADLVAAYQWTLMSRWVWIVEAVDRAAWDAGDPSVAAEVVIDATDHTGDPRPIAWRLPDQLLVWDPDRNVVGKRPLGPTPMLRSVCRVDGSLT